LTGVVLTGFDCISLYVAYGIKQFVMGLVVDEEVLMHYSRKPG
jgi:sugar phosphate permease